MPPKKEPLEPVRFSSRTRGIEADPIEVGTQSRRKRPEDVALPSIEPEGFPEEEEEIDTPNSPTPSRPPSPDRPSSTDFKMAGDEDTSNAKLLATLLERVKQLESKDKNNEDRGARGITPFNSAFGGDKFEPSGIAAHPAFRPYGEDQKAANPLYNPKAKKQGVCPGTFSGDKTLFDKWIIKIADKLEEDDETFKRERSRMAVLNSFLEGSPSDLVEARYRSIENPFLNVAEMVATLAAVYHDDNQGTKARELLKEMMFDFRDKSTDIHQFIGTVNALADKANIAKEERKRTLLEVIPATLDSRLLGDSKDPAVSYESFANKVADAALTAERANKERRAYREKMNLTAQKNPNNGHKESKTVTRKQGSPKPWENKTRATDDRKCFVCNKVGHLAKDCPDKKAAIQGMFPRRPAAVQALLDAADESDNEDRSSQSSEGSEN